MANESIMAAGGLPPGAGSLEARTVGVGRGASWWGEAWRLFAPSVGAWLLITLILLGILMVAGFFGRIPFLGWLVELGLQILWPVLVGGLMVGCRAVDRGNPLLSTPYRVWMIHHDLLDRPLAHAHGTPRCRNSTNARTGVVA